LNYPCPAEPLTDSPPIGVNLPNYTAYLLDRHGQPSPVGIPGELYVGGTGVARGYLHRPGLTAQQFLPDPYGPPGARAYRTGALPARPPTGTFTSPGRPHTKTKPRGLGLDPAEIEHALTSHPGIAQAVVIAHTTDQGNPLLVAYVVPTPGATPTVEDVRA